MARRKKDETDEKATAEVPGGPVLRITSRRAGFWRCGLQHPASPIDHPVGEFSEAEIERLRAEPMLVVEEIDG